MGLEGVYVPLFAIWLAPLVGAIMLWAFGPQLKTWAGPIGARQSPCRSSRRSPRGTTPFARRRMVRPRWSARIRRSSPGRRFRVRAAVGSALANWTLIITGVGFLIHVYSIGYMAGDKGFARFFAYMNFFVFAMLTLVLSDNFVGLLVGWGLVGLASYLLIGYCFERPSAVAAARKAFVINVVGDIGILYAVFVIVAEVGSVSYADVFAG